MVEWLDSVHNESLALLPEILNSPRNFDWFEIIIYPKTLIGNNGVAPTGCEAIIETNVDLLGLGSWGQSNLNQKKMFS